MLGTSDHAYTAANIHVPFFVKTHVSDSSRLTPRSMTAGSYSQSVFSFVRTDKSLSKVIVPACTSAGNECEPPLLHVLASI